MKIESKVYVIFSTGSSPPLSQEGKVPGTEVELVAHSIWTIRFLWVSVTCSFGDSPVCFEKTSTFKSLQVHLMINSKVNFYFYKKRQSKQYKTHVKDIIELQMEIDSKRL